MDFAQSFLDRHLRTRNAQLAKLDLLADRLGTNEQAQETFFKACKQFFEYSCKKLHCFLDLRDYVHRLDSDHQNAFRLHVVKYAKITDEDKLVKVETLLILSFGFNMNCIGWSTLQYCVRNQCFEVRILFRHLHRGRSECQEDHSRLHLPMRPDVPTVPRAST